MQVPCKATAVAVEVHMQSSQLAQAHGATFDHWEQESTFRTCGKQHPLLGPCPCNQCKGLASLSRDAPLVVSKHDRNAQEMEFLSTKQPWPVSGLASSGDATQALLDRQSSCLRPLLANKSPRDIAPALTGSPIKEDNKTLEPI